VHQESGWNPLAVSRVGAQGMAQFMPATASWWCAREGTAAADCQPQNPVWALRSLTAYDRWLWDRIKADTACDRMAMTLASYNGGLGWVLKDRKLAAAAGASASRWWGQTERYNAGRSAAAFAENRGYPVRILKVLEPRYALWGAGSCA
jgi:soluble lytic murein transglycosylase-like protein